MPPIPEVGDDERQVRFVGEVVLAAAAGDCLQLLLETYA
jgi:hypothetical protein